MKKVPNQHRTAGLWSDGNNGFFVIPHYKVANYQIRCQVSDGMGWEHVSVTIGEVGKHAKRNPTWDEMCFVKGLFWDEDECVIEYYPPKSEYVSCHPFCLHLWKPIGVVLPMPESIMVGADEFKK